MRWHPDEFDELPPDALLLEYPKDVIPNPGVNHPMVNQLHVIQFHPVNEPLVISNGRRWRRPFMYHLPVRSQLCRPRRGDVHGRYARGHSNQPLIDIKGNYRKCKPCHRGSVLREEG